MRLTIDMSLDNDVFQRESSRARVYEIERSLEDAVLLAAAGIAGQRRLRDSNGNTIGTATLEVDDA